jgi:aspartyl protease family protein
MKPSQLLMIVAGIGAMGLIMPREIHVGSSIPRETVIVESEKPPVVQSIHWYADEIVLDRASDGHFYAEASVDGQPVLFLVDTGASVVALTGDDAADLGLQWRDDELGEIGHGASGPVRGIALTIDELSLGGFRGHNVPAVIIPEGLSVSLLGQSFLSKIGNVAISDDRMVLGEQE